jgi:branched-chain amino acid transport system permease protein
MFIYPVLVMKVLCFALFACAFNLLLGYTGLLSFGHAVFLGSAGLCRRPRAQGLGAADPARPARRHRPPRRCWAG